MPTNSIERSFVRRRQSLLLRIYICDQFLAALSFQFIDIICHNGRHTHTNDLASFCFVRHLWNLIYKWSIARCGRAVMADSIFGCYQFVSVLRCRNGDSFFQINWFFSWNIAHSNSGKQKKSIRHFSKKISMYLLRVFIFNCFSYWMKFPQ